jgi:Methyltransferase FkbM domain
MEFRLMRVSFSQFGEDLIVQRIAEERGISQGFYVDAGAFHPVDYSNTLMLYKQGWRGLNIDMVQEKIDLFNRLRPLDRNVCAALDCEPRPVRYSTDSGGQDRMDCAGGSSSRKTMTRTLGSILSAEGFADRRIDYLNVDCEGFDLRVVQGIDLARHAVQILTIEALDEDAERAIRAYLAGKRMTLVDKVKWTLVFTGPAQGVR